MAEFQKSKRFKGILFSKITLFFLLTLSVILAIGLFNIIPKERETNRNKDLVLGQLGELKDQSDSLEADIEKLKTNDGIEEKIREKFRVVKDGEGLVVIVDDQTGLEGEPMQKTNSFWTFWKDLFK